MDIFKIDNSVADLDEQVDKQYVVQFSSQGISSFPTTPLQCDEFDLDLLSMLR